MYKTIQLLLVMIHRTILLGVILVAGTLIYAEIENTSYEKSAHFCWTVVTTIGYGKVVPAKKWGKIFTVLYGIFGIALALFCISAFGSFLNHILKKIIILFERCCCRREQIPHINLKIFCALVILAIGELFAGGYAMCLMNDWSYLDSVYTWFVTMTTIGFGDYVPSYPPDMGIGYALISFLINLLCLVTIASIIESVQAMIESVDNSKRNILAILFCCYNNDEKEAYDLKSYSSSTFGLDYVAE